MRNLLRFVIFCLSIWFVQGPTHAVDVAGRADIVDGDTLVVGQETVRLHGIDTAETGQRCVGAQRKFTRPGVSAMELLEKLVAGGVVCAGNEYDNYRRLIAVCRTSTGEDINRLLVAAGWAWAYVLYSSDYVAAESAAREQQLGVWSMACEAPWEFRAKRWEVAVQKAPKGCPIKGNISENGRIYHTPWSRRYAMTKIDLSKGERWFCSEKEALEAGWRASRG